MARCEQGYLCRICGLDVAEITESDLYLRYVLGEVPPEQLHLLPECHVRCNPSTAQYIVDPAFPPLVCDGPFAKTLLDAAYVAEEEARVTRAGGGCKNYPLWASQLSTIRFQPLVLILKAKQRLIGIEIKHRLSRSSPMAGVKEKDGRGVAQVADRGHAFHVAALDGLELDDDAGQGRQSRRWRVHERIRRPAPTRTPSSAGRAACRWRRRPRRRRLAIAVDDAGTGRGPRARRPTFAIAATTISSLRSGIGVIALAVSAAESGEDHGTTIL